MSADKREAPPLKNFCFGRGHRRFSTSPRAMVFVRPWTPRPRGPENSSYGFHGRYNAKACTSLVASSTHPAEEIERRHGSLPRAFDLKNFSRHRHTHPLVGCPNFSSAAADPGHYCLNTPRLGNNVRQTHRNVPSGAASVRGHVNWKPRLPPAVYYAGMGAGRKLARCGHVRFPIKSPRCMPANAGRTALPTVAIHNHGGLGFTWERSVTCSTVVRRHRKQHSEMPRFIASASPRWLSILAAHLRRARKLHHY